MHNTIQYGIKMATVKKKTHNDDIFRIQNVTVRLSQIIVKRKHWTVRVHRIGDKQQQQTANLNIYCDCTEQQLYLLFSISFVNFS